MGRLYEFAIWRLTIAYGSNEWNNYERIFLRFNAMPSTFTWLDYSEYDRRRMVDVISAFGEKDTLDDNNPNNGPSIGVEGKRPRGGEE